MANFEINNSSTGKIDAKKKQELEAANPKDKVLLDHLVKNQTWINGHDKARSEDGLLDTEEIKTFLNKLDADGKDGISLKEIEEWKYANTNLKASDGTTYSSHGEALQKMSAQEVLDSLGRIFKDFVKTESPKTNADTSKEILSSIPNEVKNGKITYTGSTAREKNILESVVSATTLPESEAKDQAFQKVKQEFDEMKTTQGKITALKDDPVLKDWYATSGSKLTEIYMGVSKDGTYQAGISTGDVDKIINAAKDYSKNVSSFTGTFKTFSGLSDSAFNKLTPSQAQNAREEWKVIMRNAIPWRQYDGNNITPDKLDASKLYKDFNAYSYKTGSGVSTKSEQEALAKMAEWEKSVKDFCAKYGI